MTGQGVNITGISSETGSVASKRNEYAVTTDMAKELFLTENNNVGRVEELC